MNSFNLFVICSAAQGTELSQYCTCPARRVICNMHVSCKHMRLSFESVCNKEHKGVICNMTFKIQVEESLYHCLNDLLSQFHSLTNSFYSQYSENANVTLRF